MRKPLLIIVLLACPLLLLSQKRDVAGVITFVIDSIVLKQVNERKPEDRVILSPYLLYSESIRIDSSHISHWDSFKEALKEFDFKQAWATIDLSAFISCRPSLLVSNNLPSRATFIAKAKEIFKEVWLSTPIFTADNSQCIVEVKTEWGADLFLLKKENQQWKRVKAVAGWNFDPVD